jgi:uncharacterized protein YjbJ (UPF0337 family)
MRWWKRSSAFTGESVHAPIGVASWVAASPPHRFSVGQFAVFAVPPKCLPAKKRIWHESRMDVDAALLQFGDNRNPELRNYFHGSNVMVNQQILEGNWNEIKGKLRSRWGQLSDDDLSQFHGEIDKLVGTIQRKTGEGREAIEGFLSEASGSISSGLGQTAENVRQYAKQAADTVQSTARMAADQVRAGYGRAERLVHERPVESLTVCFAAGLAVGVLLGVILTAR